MFDMSGENESLDAVDELWIHLKVQTHIYGDLPYSSITYILLLE